MLTLPELSTFHCLLTRIRETDLGNIQQIIEDKPFQTFLPDLYDLLKTEQGCKVFFSSFSKYEQEGSGLLWAIRISDLLIGFVAIMDIPRNSTIFYAIHPLYRGKGYAKECVKAVVSWYDRNHSGHPLHTEIHECNKASLHVVSCCPSICVMRK